MVLLKTDFIIERNQATGKKQYRLSNGAILERPKGILPKAWQQTNTSTATIEEDSYIIKCGPDLIVVDCDTAEHTLALDNVLTGFEDYIVVSDKGFKHYYFSTTEYFDQSPLKRGASSKLGSDSKLDLQQGNALVFPACASNLTKSIHQGSINNIQPIPDIIVDHLITQLKEEVQADTGDYKSNTYYMAPIIDAAIGQFKRHADYKYLEQTLRMITPSKYRRAVAPDMHPDRIPDGEGTAYIQALSSKIAGDASVSLDLHREMLGVITQELWSEPWTAQHLDEFMAYLPKQKYQNGKPVFVFEPNENKMALVSIGDNEPTQLYRTTEDKWLIPYPTGGAQVFGSESLLIKALKTDNYQLFLANQPVPPQQIKESVQKKVIPNMHTVDIVDEIYSPVGFFTRDNLSYYNMYSPTKYLGIIRGEYLQERATTTPKDFPIIRHITQNIMLDHEELDKRVDMWDEFWAHKFKTLEYSPIVPQLIGARGIGKDTIIDMILSPIAGGAGEIKMGASNSQFNADYTSMMLTKIPEIIVNPARTNEIKTLSGSKFARQEDKGFRARQVLNLNTYITSSNKKALLAETPNDRRFVLFSSSSAKQLNVPDIEARLLLELEAYCIYLRDLRLTNRQLYMNANAWHDATMLDAFKDSAKLHKQTPDLLASIASRIEVLSPEELDTELEEALGAGYHYWVARGDNLNVVLADNNPIRNADSNTITHTATSSTLGALDMGQMIKRADTNRAIYDKAVYVLQLPLNRQQADKFKSIKPITSIKETL